MALEESLLQVVRKEGKPGLVYRVEDKDGRGPFSRHFTFANGEYWCHDCAEVHSVPADVRYGAPSVKSLRDFFANRSNEYAANWPDWHKLERQGFYVAVYKSPAVWHQEDLTIPSRDGIGIAAHYPEQCVFDPSGARCLAKVPLVAADSLEKIRG